VLLLQDRRREGAFTCTLLPSEIAIVFCTIHNNLIMKDYFSMLKSSVPPQCTEGLAVPSCTVLLDACVEPAGRGGGSAKGGGRP
jgi:hypothetical protein